MSVAWLFWQNMDVYAHVSREGYSRVVAHAREMKMGMAVAKPQTSQFQMVEPVWQHWFAQHEAMALSLRLET